MSSLNELGFNLNESSFKISNKNEQKNFMTDS